MGRRVSPKEVEAEYPVLERQGRLDWEQTWEGDGREGLMKTSGGDKQHSRLIKRSFGDCPQDKMVKIYIYMKAK